MPTMSEYSLKKHEPILVGEVIRDLIHLWKNQKNYKYGKD